MVIINFYIYSKIKFTKNDTEVNENIALFERTIQNCYRKFNKIFYANAL